LLEQLGGILKLINYLEMSVERSCDQRSVALSMAFEGLSVLFASEVLLSVYWQLVSIRQYCCCMRDGVMVKQSLDQRGVDLYCCWWHWGSLALAALSASSSSLSFWRGKVYPDFPYFCGPVGIMPPS